MLNVLADQHLYNIQSYLPENINLQLFDPAQGFPPEISTAHGLLVRTVIPINDETLPEIPASLSFIGTGSAGTDHIDLDYLKKHDITFANAAGCNARSVAEYVATALLLWGEARKKTLPGLTVGIVGAGNVGTEVTAILEKLGITYTTYDPPRESRDSDFISATMEEILASDILTFHTPLTTGGDYPTYHWLNKEKLTDQSFELILNTARGGVIDEEALLQAKAETKVSDLIIDVWEDEPNIRFSTFEEAFVKTPHIAGYSIQAKNNASKFVADDLLAHFGLEAPQHDNAQGGREVKQSPSNFDTLGQLLMELHPIRTYEAKLEKIIEQHPNQRGQRFNKLRAEFPLRNEFAQIYLPAPFFDRFPKLNNLGFKKITKTQ